VEIKRNITARRITISYDASEIVEEETLETLPLLAADGDASIAKALGLVISDCQQSPSFSMATMAPVYLHAFYGNLDLISFLEQTPCQNELDKLLLAQAITNALADLHKKNIVHPSS